MKKIITEWKTEEEFVSRTNQLVKAMPEGHQTAYHNQSLVIILNNCRVTSENMLKEHIDEWGKV